MRWLIYAVIIALTAIITIVSYEPLTLAYFRISEPYYRIPLNMGREEIVIRNDAFGQGAFGAKRRGGRSHTGIDISAPVGAEVYASKSGIAFFGNVPTGYGKYVMIYHPDGCQTMYGHLSGWAGRAPRKVKRGELIGYAGKTGNASSRHMQAHLHFEIKKDGGPLDPEGLMR